MPLPPAPDRRAALLSVKAFDTPAKPRAKSRPASPVENAAPAPTARDFKPTQTLPVTQSPPVVASLAAPAPVSAPTKAVPRSKAKRNLGPTRLFVLDTNVLLHDPSCLFRFEEHDIFLPMIVLEELDAHKKGMTEVARNGRQVSRSLDALAEHQGADIGKGLPLASTGHTEARGHLFFQTQTLNCELPLSLPQGKADNQILGVVEALRKQYAPREVVLVSKDINMRVKARALGLSTDDYQNDKTLEDGDLLYSGAFALPSDFWSTHGSAVESWQQGAYTFYRVNGPIVPQLLVNQFVFFEAPGEPSLYARVTEIRGKVAVLKTLRDFTHLKNAVWGITTRNREQNFAMNLLMDPEVDFVTLTGQAGTGKTLLALASGLTQVLDERRYTEIIVTRATVSVGEDIGFLPGSEEEKMGPWMGALDDNLEVLGKTDTAAGEWGRAATNELIRSRIKIKSMNFMRGRTFLNKYVIIDEAQNLTPKQMKTLITRAGPGTKIICMGNIAQIDTPYLTEGSSGLTYAVDKFKGWAHSGHITLARGERSRLADFASEVL
ncbi:MAG: AAA family ATPase [Rhodoferax sp.]|nr:AAA family ATPase [Rhodoferax sp.]OIP23075.1 MAG: phosphate starvation-inducible protein PhoH [Comamonadaceae bacterium CG2_30_60_41]PIW07960.1 MAG: phosphate starvation-inducible protein PhoH [Comamonadaceae bacterium CG17_big_fil_post_rev_8_21_14_2_50_60_13]PIY23043.1 MAG: phosphate starvation-inducible protein PhoH [Comamonadaceae bacterium CG_4_10_14_3_um_filter_60_75]PJC12289.1 MAG: phosphate starvation-inducible protein PhoH [Comamonadaceae bacterium CG_4_9_14_0_8_um_filter_60_18]